MVPDRRCSWSPGRWSRSSGCPSSPISGRRRTGGRCSSRSGSCSWRSPGAGFTTRSSVRGSSAASRRRGVGRSLLGRERRRDGGAPRRSGARQRRAAAGRDRLDQRARPQSVAGSFPGPCSSRSPAARASSACISRGGSSPTVTTCGRSTSRRSTTPGSRAASRSSAATSGSTADARRLVGGRRRARPRRGGAADPGEPRRDPLGERRGRGGDVRRGGPRRACGASCSSPRRRSTACPSATRSTRTIPLVGVGHYGESKIEAERLCEAFARRGLETVIVRPKTFVGPERLGVFEILFDWIREGRRIPILGDGVEPLPAARGRGSRRRGRPVPRRPGRGRGAERRRRPVRDRARGPRGADRPRGLAARVCGPCPRGRPSSRSAASSSRGSRRSPSGTTGPRTGTRSSRSRRHARCSAGSRGSRTPRRSVATYDWYLAHRGELRAAGLTHRVPWDQRALGAAEATVRRPSRNERRARPARRRRGAVRAPRSPARAGRSSTSVSTRAPAGASARNSSPSARVRFATERTTRSPQRSS